ncbi:hypothetical protein HOA92_03540 [archaeon]|jgi:hypothetical protein|nr:hypothetical protein [archaeon]MBT6762085.1 hypothetical protein [archaeon]
MDSRYQGLKQTESLRNLLDHLGKQVSISSYHQFFGDYSYLTGIGNSKGELVSVSAFSGFSVVPPFEDAIHIREARSRPELNLGGNIVMRAMPSLRETKLILMSFVGITSSVHSVSNEKSGVLYDSPLKLSPVPGLLGSIADQDSLILEYKSNLFGESYTQNPLLALEWMLAYVSDKEGDILNPTTCEKLAVELCQIYQSDSPIHGMKPGTLKSKSDLAIHLYEKAKAASKLSSNDYLNKSLHSTIASVSYQQNK